MNKHKNCLICQSSYLVKIPNYYEKHELVKCSSCSFIFMENIPSADTLNKCYSTYSYSSEAYLSPITIKSYNLILDEFENYRKINRILDVGCGRGWFLQEALKRGWEVYGTEYSQVAIKICEKNKLKMSFGKLESDTYQAETFDVITSFEVIEHINNPNEELSNINRFLRKGGLFYCTTPNYNSILRYYLKEKYNIIGYPEHLSYYTKTTLNKVAKKNGFGLVKFLSTGISITRLKTSKKPLSEEFISEKSSDEMIRQKIEKKWYLGIVKLIVNYILTVFNFGMTLKGYYVKK